MTSGLPTIDYFLSSDLMEPDDADDHYSEQLVRLPGIGIHYRKPAIPWGCFYKTREDFSIRNDAIVYLSNQSTFKYLPQHDDIYPAIAKQVPGAQFVFVAANPHLAEGFRRRIENAFLAAGMPLEDRILVITRELDIFNYWNLSILADVWLDTLEWSGCNTTLEAIACELPVVTMPGKFLRGRHSYAILKQLGVTDTITPDKAHYVEMAVRMGLNPEWRKEIVRRQLAGAPQLFSNTTCVEALEEFYEELVGGVGKETAAGGINISRSIIH